MRMSTTLALSLVITLASALAGSDANAKESFVEIIATRLALPYRPPCRLCHIQGTTGPGSVQSPFGVSMLAHGLTESAASVPTALDGLGTDMIDSDGDGVSDVNELRANTDPNTAVNVPLASSGPDYGCAIAAGHRGGAGQKTWWNLAGLLAAMILTARRSRIAPQRRRAGNTTTARH